MTFDWWTVLFGASGLGIFKLLFDIYKYIKERQDKKNTTDDELHKQQLVIEQLFYDLLSGAVRIQELLESLLYEIGAARIWLIKIENGGGVPQLGTVQHISILNECIRVDALPPHGKVDSAKQDFQNYELDTSLQKMLSSMIEKKIFIAKVSELDSNILSKLYQSHGIVKVVNMPVTNMPSLGADPNKGFLIFMSVQFDKPANINEHIESAILITQEKIRQIYNSFYAKRFAKVK